MPPVRPVSALPSPLPRLWLPLTLLYTVFVVYGSLVPLDFQLIPWQEALDRFAKTPYLELGIDSRADWVANIVLYIPLTFLWQGVFWPRSNAGLRLLCWIPVMAFSVMLAVAVEFTQLFFPPRTVSLNDLIAEVAGSVIGVALWYGFGNRIARLWSKVFAGGPNASRALALLYVAGYLALALFPYDFLINMQELVQKAQSGLFHPFLARSECSSALHCTFKPLAEIAAVIPLGLLLAMSLPKQSHSIARAFLLGTGLGLVIECAQFFIGSGVSQGLSILTRGIGIAAGVYAYRRGHAIDLDALGRHSRIWAVWITLLYLFLLMSANAWFSEGYLKLESALGRIAELKFIPFYYHYYTTEMHALSSALVVTAMYMPIGLGYFLWSLRSANKGRLWIPAALAALTALVIESGKLFIELQRPDPTNVLIAACAALVTYWLTVLITRKVQLPDSHASLSAATQNSSHRGRFAKPVLSRAELHLPLMQRVLALFLLVLAGGLSLRHPAGLWLAVPFLAYAVAIWFQPFWWLVIVLGALPVLDFVPWSGWLFFDEFDLLLLLTVAVLGLRLRISPVKLPFSRSGITLLSLCGMSFFFSLMIGLWPFEALDQNAFSNYYSHYNALRLGKGALWVFVLLPFIAQAVERGVDLKRYFTTGMVLGLAGVAGIVVWERYTFSSLLDFTSDYRASANFSGMHIGGAYIDAYLALALPFAALVFFQVKPPVLKLFCIGLFAAGVYAVLVTFSRGALAALATEVVVLTTVLGAHWVRHKLRYGYLIFIPILLVAVITFPVVQSGFMQRRLDQRAGDFQVRFQHWREALQVLDQDWKTMLFGAGAGRFPAINFLNSPEDTRLATFRYVVEDGNSYLRLGTGRALYFEQSMAIQREQNYVLSIDVRSEVPDASLDIFVCKKWIVYSSQCKDLKVQTGTTPGRWERRELVFKSDNVGSSAWQIPIPVKLSLRNSNNGMLIDVDNVQLFDNTGRDVIENGSFTEGGRRWFFTTDEHLPWHVFNWPVHIVFEQGWAGLLLTFSIVAYAFVVTTRQLWRGDMFYAICLASLVGFLVVGLFDSLTDSPRISLLFYLFLIHIFVKIDVRHNAVSNLQSSSL